MRYAALVEDGILLKLVRTFLAVLSCLHCSARTVLPALSCPPARLWLPAYGRLWPQACLWPPAFPDAPARTVFCLLPRPPRRCLQIMQLLCCCRGTTRTAGAWLPGVPCLDPGTAQPLYPLFPPALGCRKSTSLRARWRSHALSRWSSCCRPWPPAPKRTDPQMDRSAACRAAFSARPRHCSPNFLELSPSVALLPLHSVFCTCGAPQGQRRCR